jgi:nucleoside phosphorylase
MRILVTFAVDAEFAPWKKMRKFEAMHFPMGHGGKGPRWHRTTIRNVTVDACLTGISVREYNYEFLLNEKPDICISSGLAGALTESLKIGDVVVARETVLDQGVEPEAGDASLLKLAEQTGAKTANRFVMTKHVLVTHDQKREIAEVGEVVEMESHEIAKQARARSIPCVAIRSISDEYHEDLPLDFEDARDRNGQIHLGRVLVQLAKRPAQLPALIRFGKRSRVAAEKLAEFLEEFVVRISPKMAP